MNHRTSRLWSIPLAILVCVFSSPVGVESQCNVTTTTVTTFTGPPDLIIVSKFLAGSYQCSLTMMNADFCVPTATDTVTYVVASAYTTTIAPVCAWNCACGQVTIDGDDGLPVELMDFGIADLELDQDGDPAGAEEAG